MKQEFHTLSNKFGSDFNKKSGVIFHGGPLMP